MNDSFAPTLKHWISRRRDEETISDAVEAALKFMRRYVCFTFSRQLMAVSNIQAEIYKAAGRKEWGDYSFFAGQAESLFMDRGLFALDEYGVPPEFSRSLKPAGDDVHSLDAALKILKGVDASSAKLHPFEREILNDVQETL